MLFFLAPQNTLTGFKKFKTMLHSSSTSLPNSTMSHLFSVPYTGSQLKKRLISNLIHFALNHWMVLPLLTSKTFTFTLLLGSSVLLQTPECSEYNLFARSQVVSALSLTKIQQHGTNSPLHSVIHPLSVPSNLPWKPFSFWKLFLQSPCPEVPVCVRMCVCVYECACIWLLFVYLNFLPIYVCIRFVSA